MYIVKMFLVPYLITLAVELIMALIWRTGWKGLLTIFWVNTITNPAVTAIRWMTKAHIRSAELNLWILIGAELAVLVTEWLLFRKFIKKVKYPFLLSLTLNAASYGAGFLTPYIFMFLAKK